LHDILIVHNLYLLLVNIKVRRQVHVRVEALSVEQTTGALQSAVRRVMVVLPGYSFHQRIGLVVERMHVHGVNVHSAEALARMIFKLTAYVFELLRLLADVVDRLAVVDIARAVVRVRARVG